MSWWIVTPLSSAPLAFVVLRAWRRRVTGPAPALGSPGSICTPCRYRGRSRRATGTGWCRPTAACSRSAARASQAWRRVSRSPDRSSTSLPTPDGGGYWLAGLTARCCRSATPPPSARSQVARFRTVWVVITPTTDGGGYWLLTAEGGVFTFGSAKFAGSLPGINVNARAVDLLARPQGDGYWIVDDAGGVHAFGGAPDVGSLQSAKVAPAGKVVGGAVTPTGAGYWLASLAGGVYTFGDAANLPVSPIAPGQHVVGIAAALRRRGTGSRRATDWSPHCPAIKARTCVPSKIASRKPRLLDGAARRADGLVDEPGRHGVPEVQRSSSHRRRRSGNSRRAQRCRTTRRPHDIR